jgi:hypothetical protein
MGKQIIVANIETGERSVFENNMKGVTGFMFLVNNELMNMKDCNIRIGELGKGWGKGREGEEK